jgi:hypothetical protein
MFAQRSTFRAFFGALAIAGLPIAAGATPGLMTCQQLRQMCESRVAGLKDVLAHVSPDEVDSAAASQNISGYDCQGRYDQAQQSGVFPGRTPEPDLPCAD